MENLRIVNVQIIDSTTIVVKFTDKLFNDLVLSNVSILPDGNIPAPEVLKLKVSGDTLTITCKPLTAFAVYYLQFQSVDNHRFMSVNNTAVISEDGISNRYLFTGPLPQDNPVYDYLTSFYKDNIYNISDDSTIIGSYIRALSVILSQALYDIGQVGNENYLSFTVADEKKIRGNGPYDRLNEDAAYEVIRLGKAPSSANADSTYSSEEFPSYPITLQKETNVEILTPDSINEDGLFNINSLILNLSKYPVSKVLSITFTQTTLQPTYTYDVETLGYQILNSRYDPDYASTYYQLEDNQVKLNEALLEDPSFELDKVIRVEISYEYKHLGKIINASTVEAYALLDVSREVLPPIVNVFTLNHAPIVDNNNEVPITGEITFDDPNNPGVPHPAFSKEIPFRLNALPHIPGQYAVDYSSSTVYVYGQDVNNDGTGAYPPVASYQYRYTFTSQVDYVYDPDLFEVVALPYGNLINYPGTVSFNYEEVLVPNIDYVANLHAESLNERIENRLVALNALKVKNFPITSVFRIYNETSGEIYSLSRWYEDKVYFRYINPPKINSTIKERTSFETIPNEMLFVNTTITNANSLRVFKILLDNNTIISGSEDCIGSSINSSVVFSNNLVFVKERWYNKDLSDTLNIDLLSDIGEYSVDYNNGIIYCAVSSSQLLDIGTVSYKINSIVPQYPHLISVDDVYYQINQLGNKLKQFKYSSFDEGSIVVSGLDRSDEALVNETSTIYQLSGGSVGYFDDVTFVPGVFSEVKFVRGLFEYNDLLNSTYPIDFSTASTSSDFDVTVSSINKSIYTNVQLDVDGYYILLDENIPYLSPNITQTFSIIRTSDGYELWDNAGVVVEGSQLKLILSGVNTPLENDFVYVSYSFSINNLSRIVIDYNKGDLFVDYTYLADEILVSYEYGDNVIDFRQNTGLSSGSPYYVTYKVGALRDALEKNFGMLINIKELMNLDVDFNRERYRDALTAALGSFVKGPTLSAIKDIGKTISHVEPEIIESAFKDWILGSSILNPQEVATTGSFELLPAKFGNGVLVDQDQTISLPMNSNIRLEEGTFETWVLPQWSGIDNQSNLSLTILKDGYAIDLLEVFIGSEEQHPSEDTFSINKKDINSGTPNLNKDGVFIYYDTDVTGDFSRWYVRVIDGYVDGVASSYRISLTSDGSFYDAKSTSIVKPSNVMIFTGINKLNFNITGTVPFDEGITFISDYNHYIVDFGKEANKSRFSIYKDLSGYLNFRIFDKFGKTYNVSSDISSWQINEPHFIATSWKLNNINSRDEMHLFIDGLEVENIIKHGQRSRPYLHEKFRTINSEQIIGYTLRDTVGYNDLITTSGSNDVSSSVNFSLHDIQIGDTIHIDNDGFSSTGYLITNINGQTLTLDTAMPLSISGATYSVNRLEFTVQSEVDVAPGMKVTKINSVYSGNDLNTNSTNIVTSTVNFIDEGVLPGYSIRINNDSDVYAIGEVNTNSLTLVNDYSDTLSGVDFTIYSNEESELYGLNALRPDYDISKDDNYNNILTISNNISTDDLILVKTLGLGFRTINEQYYVWSDHVENILMTRLPPPISLDDVNITKIILPTVGIGSANSTLVVDTYHSNNLDGYQPSISQNGRTLSVTIGGTNADFTTPVEVTINGVSGVYTISETLTFTDYGTLDFINQYTTVNYISVIAKPISVSKTAVSISVKEKYAITYSESSGLVPVIRYSYIINGGSALYEDGYGIVTDDSKTFSDMSVGGYLVISSPITVAGFYKITGVSSDRKSLYIEGTSTSFPLPLSSFTGGQYQILNTTSYRSGLQNGLFTFESANMPGEEYFLMPGPYQIKYNSYLRIQLDPLNCKVYIGSDLNGLNQANCVIDHVKTYSTMLSDIRYGEVVASSIKSITKDYNSLKGPTKDSETLALISFDSFPFTNDVDYYINSKYLQKHFYSSNVVNDSFNDSIVITDKSLKLSNDGVLDTKKQSTIEFWVNPMFDTANDPNERYYFDAYGAITEEVVSTNNVSLKLGQSASSVLSVKLKNGSSKIDYFAGGSLEIDTQNAIAETLTSTSTVIVTTTYPILQIISVKAVDDLTGQDYFTTGAIGTDNKTIYLGKALPYANTSVIVTYKSSDNNKKTNTQVVRLNKKLPKQKCSVLVTYIPKGLQGDRISIYKDIFGYMNFSVIASGAQYTISAPTRWVANTWHRIKASYIFNSNSDDMRLFIDGYQYSNLQVGGGEIVGDYSVIVGASYPGVDGYSVGSIKFKDPINDLYIGSQFDNTNTSFALFDNFRISNIFRPIYQVYGEPIDINYNSNLNIVFPVVKDLYTTYLSEFDLTSSRTTDFATLKNRKTGNFDFSINIFDSFDIISSSDKVKQILEKLIKTLKPANSKVYITYTK